MSVISAHSIPELDSLPDSWELSTLQGVCGETITYGIVQCGPHVETGVPYIRVSDMNGPKLDVTGMLRTSPAIAASFQRSTVRTGEIVYAMRGLIGEVRQVPDSCDGANLTQGTARISPNGRVQSEYLLWTLRSSSSLRQADLEAKGSTFREIPLANIRRIVVPVPPLEEQRAIAEALSDVDALIHALDELIAKKRQIKQGTMQQLLTGKKRLPGFDSNKNEFQETDIGPLPVDWQIVSLAELIQTGRSIRYGVVQPGSLVAGGCIMLRSQDYSKGWVDSGMAMRIAPSLAEQYRNARIQVGDLIMTVVGANTGQVAVAPPWLAGAVLSRSTSRIAVDSDNADSLFVKAVLEGPVGKRQILDQIKEGAQPVVSCQDVAKIQVPLPSINEQRDIGAVLSDMAKEITALEQKRDKTKLIKQGMMQELLTGRTRLL